MRTYVKTWETTIIHRLSNVGLDDPEGQLHAHNIDIELELPCPNEGDWYEAAVQAATFEQWLAEHIFGRNLTDSMRFDTAPARLVDYLYTVAVGAYHLHQVTLSVSAEGETFRIGP